MYELYSNPLKEFFDKGFGSGTNRYDDKDHTYFVKPSLRSEYFSIDINLYDIVIENPDLYSELVSAVNENRGALDKMLQAHIRGENREFRFRRLSMLP